MRKPRERGIILRMGLLAFPLQGLGCFYARLAVRRDGHFESGVFGSCCEAGLPPGERVAGVLRGDGYDCAELLEASDCRRTI